MKQRGFKERSSVRMMDWGDGQQKVLTAHEGKGVEKLGKKMRNQIRSTNWRQ